MNVCRCFICRVISLFFFSRVAVIRTTTRLFKTATRLNELYNLINACEHFRIDYIVVSVKHFDSFNVNEKKMLF